MSHTAPDMEKLRRVFASLGEHAVSTEACPEPDRLWQARRGELAPETTRALVSHTVACAACAEAWRLAGEVGGLAPVDAGRPGARPWWGGWTALAAAAAVATVAVGTLLQPGGRPPAYRERRAVVVRSLVPDGQPLPRSRCLLRWSPGPSGSRYDVRVATEDLRVVATAHGLEASEYLIPAEALAALPRGSGLFWQVEMRLPDGNRVASTTFRARLE